MFVFICYCLMWKKNISDPYIDASGNQLEVSHKDPFLGHFYSQKNKNDFNF